MAQNDEAMKNIKCRLHVQLGKKMLECGAQGDGGMLFTFFLSFFLSFFPFLFSFFLTRTYILVDEKVLIVLDT